MRIKTSLFAAAAAAVALLANTHARSIPHTNSVNNHLDALAGRAPIDLIAPEVHPDPDPAPEGEPDSAPGAPEGPEGPGGAPKVSNEPAYLSIPETGLPKPSATVPPATQAKSIAPSATKPSPTAPSATEPKPVAPTGPAPGSGNNKPSTPCKRGILGARCDDSDDDSGDDSEPVGAPARAQPPSGSWYDFVDDSSKVQNARKQFDQRINNPEANDIPTGSLDSYAKNGGRLPNSHIVDVDAAGIGSILTALGRRGEISDEGDQLGSQISIRSLKAPAAGGGAVQETAFTSDNKMIIARFTDAANDGTPANEGRMTWDQLVFVQFKQLSGGDTGDLKFIGRSEIQNKATLKTMLDVFQRNGYSTPDEMSKVVTIRSVQDGAVAGGPESQAFDALSWSDNVNGVYWLLSDFHNALKNKRISQFHLRFGNTGGKNLEGLTKFFSDPIDPDNADTNASADILIELASA